MLETAAFKDSDLGTDNLDTGILFADFVSADAIPLEIADVAVTVVDTVTDCVDVTVVGTVNVTVLGAMLMSMDIFCEINIVG